MTETTLRRGPNPGGASQRQRPVEPGDGRPRPSAAGECRCCCGSLLARRTEGGIELKCRRCKRTLIVPFPADEDATREDARAPPASPPRIVHPGARGQF